MYKIKMLCYEFGSTSPYVDEPAFQPQFETEENAYAYMLQLAEEEVSDLNSNTDTNLISFKLTRDKGDSIIRVLADLYKDENDKIGVTDQVTTYYLEEV